MYSQPYWCMGMGIDCILRCPLNYAKKIQINDIGVEYSGLPNKFTNSIIICLGSLFSLGQSHMIVAQRESSQAVIVSNIPKHLIPYCRL